MADNGPNYLSEALFQALRDLGYVEGQNLAIDYGWMGGRETRYDEIAGDLISPTWTLSLRQGIQLLWRPTGRRLQLR
jgi:hypothetical protein